MKERKYTMCTLKKDTCTTYKRLKMQRGEWQKCDPPDAGRHLGIIEVPSPVSEISLKSPIPSLWFTGLHLEKYHALLPFSQLSPTLPNVIRGQHFPLRSQFSLQLKPEKVNETSTSFSTTTKQRESTLCAWLQEGDRAIITTDSTDRQIRPIRDSSCSA